MICRYQGAAVFRADKSRCNGIIIVNPFLPFLTLHRRDIRHFHSLLKSQARLLGSWTILSIRIGHLVVVVPHIQLESQRQCYATKKKLSSN